MTSYDKLSSLCLLKHIVIARAAHIETALENIASMVPRCHPYRNDILNCSFCLLQNTAIARAALIETARKTLQAWYPDVTRIEMTSYDKLPSLCLLKHIVIARAALIETALETLKRQSQGNVRCHLSLVIPRRVLINQKRNNMCRRFIFAPRAIRSMRSGTIFQLGYSASCFDQSKPQ